MSELNGFIQQSMLEINKHVEEFAAAFIQKTDLDPTTVKMVTQVKGDLSRVIWFEPFPTGSEIEIYRIRAEKAEVDLAALRELTRWRPCREDDPETQPKEDGFYQVLVSGKYQSIEYYSVENGWATDRQVTHWMPLMPLPEAE